MIQKMLKLTESPQVRVLVSIVLIKHHQLICLLLDVAPLNQLKKTIGEKVLPFTHSPKLEIRIVKWLWRVKTVSMQYCFTQKSWIRGCTPPLLIQNVMDWLHDTCSQTIMSCPSQFQSLQRQELVWCDHHECGSSHIRYTMVRQKYHHFRSI